MDVRGKLLVVTGAGNGIGREAVRVLLARGASVAGVDLSAAGLAETAALAAAGTRFTAHAVDIADRDAVAALPDAVAAAHGGRPADGILNIAGVIQRFVRIADLPYAEIEKVMNVNFWGVVHMCKAFLPVLVARPEAAILNVSSMGGYAPVPGQAAYGASKAAVTLLTEALYAELLDTGVAVTVVFPGAVATDIAAHSGVTIEGADTAAAARKTTSPARAAEVIVGALEKGRFRATIGSDAATMDRLSRLSPRMATRLIARQMRDLLA